MTRLWSFLPLVPCLAASIAWLSPPSFATLVYNSAVVSFNVFRANVFVGSFYASALMAIALLCLRPSGLTATVGLATSFVFLNIVYLWTAAHITVFQWLVWAAWSPSNGIGFYALDWLTVGMVGLSATISLVTWTRKGATVAIIRVLEVASLAVLPLPAYVMAFDYSEFYLHAANIGPVWLTNLNLLVGTAGLLATTSLADYLVHRERTKRAISSSAFTAQIAMIN